MARRTLNIVQLYPNEMNIYGDFGNVQIVKKRVEWFGYDAELSSYEPGSDISILERADIILGGGGQDSGQRKILADLMKIKPTLLRLARDGLPMLMICGLYQLFGHYFQTKDGDKLAGIGLFDMVTIGSDKRMIGNIVIKNSELGELIGYENHSGITRLSDNQKPLGLVIGGDGNDGHSGYEGAVKYNVYGSYLHGPILSKNPILADKLIGLAVQRKYGEAKLSPCDERAINSLRQVEDWVKQARLIAKQRPR